MRLFFSAFLFALWALGAIPAVAQTRETREARSLFERGLRAAEQEHWADALELFRRSRALAPRPSVLYNEAQVLVRLGRFVEARAALRDFRSAATLHGASDADRARLERSRELSAEIDRQVATLVVRVDPSDAIVEVDGEPALGSGPARTLELDPGRHAITVRGEGRDPRSFTVALLSGSASIETVTLAESSATRLIVEPDDPTARIELDGEPFGTGRVESAVSGGRHVVRVVPQTGEARERTIDVAPGTTLTVDLGASSVSADVTSEDWFWGLVIGGGVLVVAGAAVGIGLATYDAGSEAPIPGDVGPGGVIATLTF